MDLAPIKTFLIKYDMHHEKSGLLFVCLFVVGKIGLMFYMSVPFTNWLYRTERLFQPKLQLGPVDTEIGNQNFYF